MRTPHLQGRRENLESGLDNRILKFRAAPHNNSCIACGERFIPKQQWHPHCPLCYHGTRLFAALTRYCEVSQ